jgi:hypothetical protein
MVVMAVRGFMMNTRDKPVRPNNLKNWRAFVTKYSQLLPSMTG